MFLGFACPVAAGSGGASDGADLVSTWGPLVGPAVGFVASYSTRAAWAAWGGYAEARGEGATRREALGAAGKAVRRLEAPKVDGGHSRG